MHAAYDDTKTDQKHKKSYTSFAYAWNTRVQLEAAKRVRNDEDEVLVLRLKTPAHLKLHFVSRKGTLNAAEDTPALLEAEKTTYRTLKAQRPSDLRPAAKPLKTSFPVVPTNKPPSAGMVPMAPALNPPGAKRPSVVAAGPDVGTPAAPYASTTSSLTMPPVNFKANLNIQCSSCGHFYSSKHPQYKSHAKKQKGPKCIYELCACGLRKDAHGSVPHGPYCPFLRRGIGPVETSEGTFVF